MTTDKPAYTEQFEPDRLPTIAPLGAPNPISRDWAMGDRRGAGVKVAVIDSGIDADHPDVGHVEGYVALEHDPDSPDGARAIEGEHDDLYGHGTACAAIIRSLAPDVELYSIRVLGARLTGKAVVFAAGVRWAIAHGLHVANLSLSTARTEHIPLFHDVTDRAYFHRLMLVSAINNEPEPSFPSEFSAVFSVACHDGKDPEQWDYNPDGPVEWGAPGIDIDVAWSGGSHIETTGNSFAAPHIAGHVARILGAHPHLAPFEVKTILRSLAANAGPADT